MKLAMELSYNPVSLASALTAAKLAKLVAFLIRTFSIALAIVSVGSYIVLSPPVLTLLVPGLILCPPKSASSVLQITHIDNVPIENVQFESANKAKLHGWFLQSPNPNAKVMLFCHGNGGTIGHCKSTFSRWLKAGVSVFAFDYQGYGKSSGKAIMSEALKDGDAAFSYLTNQRHVPAKNILVFGQSFGGAVACDVVKKHDCAALVVESSFSSLMSVAQKDVGFFNMYPSFLTPIPAMDNASVLAAKHPPLLLIHGTKDRLIPVSEADRNFAVASEPKEILYLKNSDHGMVQEDFETYQEAITDFVAKL